jgi:hypothetical protein
MEMIAANAAIAPAALLKDASGGGGSVGYNCDSDGDVADSDALWAYV